MKKTLLIALLAFTVLPFVGHAQQIDEPATISQVNALVQQIRDLLIQEIAILQAQLDSMNSAQVAIQSTQAIQQKQLDNLATVAAPSKPVATIPAVSFGATDCTSGKPVVPVSFNTPYRSLFVQVGTQKNSYTTPLAVIDYMSSGEYAYHIKAWDGSTAPFTENTWEDTRTLLLDTTGTLTIADCAQNP